MIFNLVIKCYLHMQGMDKYLYKYVEKFTSEIDNKFITILSYVLFCCIPSQYTLFLSQSKGTSYK